jgi:hypothetical protein
MLANTVEGNAQQARDATGDLNAIVTRQVQAGKQKEAEAILREMQATTLANDKGVVSGMSGIAHAADLHLT